MPDLIYDVLLEGQSVIAWMASFVLAALLKFIADKTEDNKYGKYVGRGVTEISDAVAEVYQTYVKSLKFYSEDGTLTDDEKATAKDMAIEAAKANLGMKGVKRLSKVLGFGLPGDALDDWMESKVEATVAGMKASAKAAAPPL